MQIQGKCKFRKRASAKIHFRKTFLWKQLFELNLHRQKKSRSYKCLAFLGGNLSMISEAEGQKT